MPIDSPLFAIPNFPEIKALLDKVIDGNEPAYYDFLRELQSPNVYGKWQLVHTLKYVCWKADQKPEQLVNCHPFLLYDLASFLSENYNIWNTLPETHIFLSLLKHAAAKENRGAQAGLMRLLPGLETHNKTYRHEKADLDELIGQCQKLEGKINLDKHENFLLAVLYNYFYNHPPSNSDRDPNHKDKLKEYLKKAIADKHPIAIIDFTVWHEEPENHDSADSQAHMQLTEVANLGHPYALYFLSTIYDNGLTFGKEIISNVHNKIIELYLKAANLGIIDAMHCIVSIYFYGFNDGTQPENTESNEQDFLDNQAVDWLKKSIATYDCFDTIDRAEIYFFYEPNSVTKNELEEYIAFLINAFKMYAPNADGTTHNIIKLASETHKTLSSALSRAYELLVKLNGSATIIPPVLQSAPSKPSATNVVPTSASLTKPHSLNVQAHALLINATNLEHENELLKGVLKQRDKIIEQQTQLIALLHEKNAMLQQQSQQNAANSQLWRDASEQRNNKRNAPDSLASADTRVDAAINIAQDKSDDLNTLPSSHRKAARGS